MTTQREREEQQTPANGESDDRELATLMEALDPEPHRLAQLEDRVLAAYDRPPRQSLAAEWIGLLRLRPISMPALALAGAAAIVLLSPAAGILAMLIA